MALSLGLDKESFAAMANENGDVDRSKTPNSDWIKQRAVSASFCDPDACGRCRVAEIALEYARYSHRLHVGCAEMRELIGAATGQVIHPAGKKVRSRTMRPQLVAAMA